MPFGDYYKNRRVLVTGHTGFKGAWLSTWLISLGADVHGIALAPETDPALFDVLGLDQDLEHTILDIRDASAVQQYIEDTRPEVIFHLAAQALVRRSYDVPVETLSTNIMGTAHVLDAVRRSGYDRSNPCTVIVITSDKCYENRETFHGYRETDPVGGHDPYSASKGAAEIVAASFRRSFFMSIDGSPPSVAVATCRAGNVIGGGDWSKDRIVVDSVNALIEGRPIPVRNPLSIRPWQHVLEPLSGYLHLGSVLSTDLKNRREYSGAWNFGPGREAERTVEQLCEELIKNWGSGRWEQAREGEAVHEARFLKLAIDKAWHFMRWHPVLSFERSVAETVAWYKRGDECGLERAAMRDMTFNQIRDYTEEALSLSLRWAIDG